jgi:hypothetical protein
MDHRPGERFGLGKRLRQSCRGRRGFPVHSNGPAGLWTATRLGSARLIAAWNRSDPTQHWTPQRPESTLLIDVVQAVFAAQYALL